MKKRDVLELKRRLKKEECTFTKMCGCYVNSEKEIVVSLDETFLNLKDEEFYKYLDIANKTLSGTMGNNLLELSYSLEEESAGGRQQFLMGLRESKLKNPELLETLYHFIIDHYDYVGNFLILVFHDAYDVMTRTSDNNKLDESEEVYEYLICAVCPVTLSKPGLGYREEEHRIGARIRDWVVAPPENGFLFPAFSDRSSDIHSILYYTKNPKEPHPEFMENILGCPAKRTAHEQKTVFQNIVKTAVTGDEEESEELFLTIQENLNTLIEEKEQVLEKDAEPVQLTKDSIPELMANIEVPTEVAARIERSFAEEFSEEPPVAEHLLDNKALAVCEQHKKENDLKEQVKTLTRRLEEQEKIPDADAECNVILKVAPEKIPDIKSEIIDGRKCLIIPLEENEHANVNGKLDDELFQTLD